MFSAFHEFLVDHFAGKVLARFDVDCFLDDGISAGPKVFAGAVLQEIGLVLARSEI
jgi:hypothetical protein